MSIRPRLLIAFSSVAVIGLIVGLIGVFSLLSIKAADKNAYDNGTVSLAVLLDLSKGYDEVRVALRDEILSTNQADNDTYFAAYKKGVARVDKAVEDYGGTITDEADRANYGELKNLWGKYKTGSENIMELSVANKNTPALAFLRTPDWKATAIGLAEVLQKIVDFNIKFTGDTNKANEAHTNGAVVILLLASILGLVLSLILGLTISNAIATPLLKTVSLSAKVAAGDLKVVPDAAMLARPDEVGLLAKSFQTMIQALDAKAQALQTVSQGDLTQPIAPASEADGLGQSLVTMKNSLKRVLGEVVSAVGAIDQGTQQISQAAQSISTGASDQASSLEEISASMRQMTASIAANSENARSTEQIAIRSALDTRESAEAVANTVKAMKEIAAKISVVQEIAGQTNLLAINAAIEAARAGEQGRGFAVVASEVQKLAERSQAAAVEITQLTATSMQISETAGQRLTKLTPDIQKTADLVQEISASSTEQSAGVAQIHAAIQQLDSRVQQNAAASEELASVAEESLSMVEQLRETVSYFKVGGEEPRGRNRPSETLKSTSTSPDFSEHLPGFQSF